MKTDRECWKERQDALKDAAIEAIGYIHPLDTKQRLRGETRDGVHYIYHGKQLIWECPDECIIWGRNCCENPR